MNIKLRLGSNDDTIYIIRALYPIKLVWEDAAGKQYDH